MLEEDAKKKWCPFVRMGSVSGGINRDAQTPHYEHYMCIGSQCMMWNSWEYKTLVGFDDATNEIIPSETRHKGEGDCGLKPGVPIGFKNG